MKLSKNISSLRYKVITVEMNNGIKFKTRSTYSAEFLKLDLDPIIHSAWTMKINITNSLSGEVYRFKDKFKELDFNN